MESNDYKQSETSSGMLIARGCRRRRWKSVQMFSFIMCAVIGVQGAYLGYVIGVLTNMERRFEISSFLSGLLLSMYDIGHMLSVLLVGYFFADCHKPRITAIGVLLSSFATFLMTLPNFLYGPINWKTVDTLTTLKNSTNVVAICANDESHQWQFPNGNSTSIIIELATVAPQQQQQQQQQQQAHTGPYVILAISQILSGISTAPFNTVAYIYIDDNVNNRESPFYLGLLTGMYAFGPAFGFFLSAWCTDVFVDLTVPENMDPSSSSWIGAWWLGFLILALLYLIFGIPLFFFPKHLNKRTKKRTTAGDVELDELAFSSSHNKFSTTVQPQSLANSCKFVAGGNIKALPTALIKLFYNPVYVGTTCSWIFSAYLIGGYGTYLPKFIETQFKQTASMANVYSGFISIGSMAISTTFGGYLLSRFNVKPRLATLLLLITWSITLVGYLLGIILGCEQQNLAGKLDNSSKWNFTNECNRHCNCPPNEPFNPVCDGKWTYFSPCHAGCHLQAHNMTWLDCGCTAADSDANVLDGLCKDDCQALPKYIAVMFVSFFIGNLFLMTTVTLVLRSVENPLRSLALSLGSFLTTVLGFSPSPILYGMVVDSSCIVWDSIPSSGEAGNCLLYDNRQFRNKLHISSGGFQLAALLAILFTYYKENNFVFPQEDAGEKEALTASQSCDKTKYTSGVLTHWLVFISVKCTLSSLRRQVSLASEFAASGWYFLVGKVKLHREYFSLFPSYHTYFVQRSANLRRATTQQQKYFSDPIPIPEGVCCSGFEMIKRQRKTRSWLCWMLPEKFSKWTNIRLFSFIMCVVIAIQGAYLGYIVGVLTNIEKRFEISSSHAGTLLSMYDIGHTLTVLFVGYFLADCHKPRITGIGVMLSSLAMFLLALPNFIFGPTVHHPNFDQLLATNATTLLVCHENELDTNLTNPSTTVGCEETFHYGAYAIIAFAQLLAGISAAPFNTIAYIYIDDNVSNRDSPFYLGLLTGMYAFGPAFGFLLSAGCTNIFVDLQDPVDINRNSPFWIGAWWLGFVVCGILYIIFGIPLFFFPYRLSTQRRLMDRIDGLDASTPLSDNSAEITKPATLTTSCKQVVETAKALPQALYRLIKNPVYTSMALGWIFGSYLIGGYGTYLPKFIETQFSQTASMADIYSGLISIGSVAFSTALGGYLLSRFNIQPRFATLLLIITWAIIFFTYLLGIAFGCDQVTFKGMEQGNGRWNFTTECSQNCHCSLDHQFKPVCDGQWTYYSPCYAGCRFQAENKTWMNCQCAAHGEMTEDGVCPSDCTAMSLYITTMFVGLFIGNLFFMTTMTVVLRSVELQERSLALSFASFLTNVLGFIPSPIIFGMIIDSSCVAWHSPSSCRQKGNCLLYDNQEFRFKYHSGNAGFQLAAIIVVMFTYYKEANFPFPESDIYDEESCATESDKPALDEPAFQMVPLKMS
ncbi:Solute carrier organic anion transporter family member 5A1 [Trichinella sp. T6]|nr:Solute carrier organic anion transporter family member 5A1 [Trichinella sp. T6]